MIYLRSALFFPFFVLGIIFFATLICLVWPVTQQPFRQRLAKGWAHYNRLILAAICNLRDSVEGMENLPPPPYVILSKHQSAWETITYLDIFPSFVWALKRELKYVPFFGWALVAVGEIFLDRSHSVEAMKTLLKESRAAFDRGYSLLVFPEGTRVAYGEVGNYQAGGVSVALSCGVPIVPVAHNAGYFWSRRSFLKKPGTIRVRIGKPIPTTGLTPAGRKVLLEQVRETIEGMARELS
ncbi:MAG: 1-acyl-sn-glycerol-3-phosphate acyltransferase [Magnetococcales bacterium]|nr:1-acyl-sn-glycerol-3-phosphate acyltransferase [Magnetococcales bacterium]NGZ25876.1 1-acyl-sn-glycerol-3-phosphate acyltransferase [Magnetococcales bacterium]